MAEIKSITVIEAINAISNADEVIFLEIIDFYLPQRMPCICDATMMPQGSAAGIKKILI